MRGFGKVLFALLFFFNITPSNALADPPFLTLLPEGNALYRFDYRGDRTRIEIALDTQGVRGIDLLVYTPAQMQAAGGGGELRPVGRGTPGAGHDSFWTGNFNAPGVYEVSVENHTSGPVLYHLSITGDSVGAVAQVLEDPPSLTSSFTGQSTLRVTLPAGAGPAALVVQVPAAPTACTHAFQIPPIISQSVLLCPEELYPPLHLIGNNIGIYSDSAHSALVATGGRQFAIIVEGSHNLVEGVTILAGADAADLGAWLCQYDECKFPTLPHQTILNGGISYGGGLLLRGSHSTIHSVTVHGGTIGIATVDGIGNYILDNQLSDLNGWGVFNSGSKDSYFVGNVVNRENHGCTTPDGFKFLHGCETSGWVCLACSGNVVARNHCESSANCFYMSGERGLASDGNKLVANYCAGATDNCFEITFSKGNVLQDNVTTADPNTGASCNYPFWIGGSTIYMKDNLWQCAVSVDDALGRAAASTTVPTLAILGDAALPPRITVPPQAGSGDSTGEPNWRAPHGLIE